MRQLYSLLGLCGLLAVALAGCGGGGPEVSIAGSSTVGPITQTIATTFKREHGGVNVAIEETGTGGGFKKFTANPPETAINNASRPIAPSEIEAAQAAGTEFIELPVAYDALAVVVHPDNPVTSLTVDQLRQIFRHDNPYRTWNEVDASLPQEEIKIFMPGDASGTYDYFHEAVMGDDVRFRDDDIMTTSESDNMLVRGISESRWAIGYFGLAYYVENAEVLKAVAIQNADGESVLPAAENVINGTYTPLSRPLFIYVNKAAAEREEVAAFVDHYLETAPSIAEKVGYAPLTESEYELVRARWEARTAGTMYGAGSEGRGLAELMQR